MLAILLLAFPLTIAGGHDTDPRDHGRPVILIANALGVPEQTFRDAFSHVTPDPAQVQRNKSILMTALAPLGVTNDLLDRVSDYYRYPPGRDRLWTNSPASAYAVMKDGAVTSIVITDPGAGYTSPPQISIAGHPEIALKAQLVFGRNLKTNGSISAITVR